MLYIKQSVSLIVVYSVRRTCGYIIVFPRYDVYRTNYELELCAYSKRYIKITTGF